jgi:kynurenine aminotransferase
MIYRYLDSIRMPGGMIKCVPLHPPARGATETCSASEWSIDFAELAGAITSRTKMVVLNNPHNPVGKVFSQSELQQIGDICVKHQVMILSDEVYDRLNYVQFHRIATLSPEIQRLTLTVGSAGKHFFCTGWRVGWVIGPADLIDYVATAHTKICYCTPSPFQEAAAVAYEQSLVNGFWSATRAEMRAKIDRFCEVFKELDVPYSDPQGGYFVLANMAKVKLPNDYHFPPHVDNRRRDFKLAWFLIMELGVAAIPPTEFYSPEHEHLGEDYLRFAICKNDDVIDLAKERLRGLKSYIN